jgi:hypothetical protein
MVVSAFQESPADSLAIVLVPDSPENGASMMTTTVTLILMDVVNMVHVFLLLLENTLVIVMTVGLELGVMSLRSANLTLVKMVDLVGFGLLWVKPQLLNVPVLLISLENGAQKLLPNSRMIADMLVLA